MLLGVSPVTRDLSAGWLSTTVRNDGHCDGLYSSSERNEGYLCADRESEAMLSALPNHRLPTAARAIGVEQLHHHEASDDARVAARIHIARTRRITT